MPANDATIIKTARSRQGQSVPILEYDFDSGVRLTAGTEAAHAPLSAGSAYLVVSSVPAFISVGAEQNGAVGDSNAKSTYLAAGIPFHLFVSDSSFISVLRAGDDSGSFFITRVKDK